MEDKPLRVKCDLRIRGTDEANSKAEKDLEVPDPDENVAKAALEEAFRKENDEEEETEEENGSEEEAGEGSCTGENADAGDDPKGPSCDCQDSEVP